MQKLNLAVIGVVNAGKSSFINSFVNKPISTVSLRRETFVPIKFTFDSLKNDNNQKYALNLENNDLLRKKGELPELATKNITIAKNLDLIESITDYPGLNDSNDKRDIFGHLVSNLPQYDLVLFVVKAEDALVQSSEVKIYEDLKKAVQENYNKGHYCKLLIIVTRFDINDEELEEVYNENITKKKLEAFKWNSFNAIIQSYNRTEFEREYTKEWNKIKSGGKKEDLFDINGFDSFLKKQSENILKDKVYCQFLFNSYIYNFSKLNGAIDYYYSKVIQNKSVFRDELAKKIKSFIINLKTIRQSEFEIITKALGIISLIDIAHFLKAILNIEIYDNIDFLKKYDKSYGYLFEGYFPKFFTPIYFQKYKNIFLMELFARNYLKEQLKTVTFEKITTFVFLLQEFIDLRYLIESFVKTPKNRWKIVNQNIIIIIDLFPVIFKDYRFLYNIYHFHKISKERLFQIFNEPCLYPGYTKTSILNYDCSFCGSKTDKYFGIEDSYSYICVACNP